MANTSQYSLPQGTAARIADRQELPPNMRAAALDYAAKGWLVIPLHTPTPDGCSCKRDSNCTAIGKHPRTRYGLSDATTNPEQIRSWWTRWPDANIGILTGSASGVLVLDLDDRNEQ